MDKMFTLAAIEAFCENGNDYSQILPFFVLQCFKRKEYEQILISEIQKDLSDKFNIPAPTASINAALDILVERKDISRKNDAFILLEKGNRASTELDHKIKESRRCYSALLEKLYKFSINKTPIPHDELEKKLLSFIHKNINATINVLESNFSLDNEEYTEEELLILSFICEIEKNDNVSFKTLSSLVNAEIVRCVIQKHNIDTSRLQINNMSLFLDTNILVGLFGFDLKVFSQRMLELIEIAKDFKFNIRIFDFTKQEFISTLSRYKREYNSIILPHDGVRDICYKMKYRGYSIMDVETFINNIDEKLAEMGIEVDDTNAIDFEKIIKEDRPFSCYAENRDTITIRHDTQAIHLIKHLRNGLRTTIENSGILFVTDDSSVYKYAKDLKGDREFPYVLRHDTLTNLLWIRGDSLSKAKIPIYNIIAGNENKLLIKKDILEQFIKRIKSNKNLTEKDVISIVTSSHISKILADHSIGDVLKQDDTVLMQKVDTALEKDKQERELNNRQIKQLEERLGKLENEREALKSNLLKHAEKIESLNVENKNLQQVSDEQKKQIQLLQKKQNAENGIRRAKDKKIFERILKETMLLIVLFVFFTIHLFCDSLAVAICSAFIPCLIVSLYAISIVSNKPIPNKLKDFLGEAFESKNFRKFFYKCLSKPIKFQFTYDELYSDNIEVKPKQ